MGWLSVLDSGLNAFDIHFDVAVGHEHVEPAIEIVVEEEATEAQGEKAGSPDFRTRRFVDKQPVTLIVIEREHLVGKVRNHQAWISGSIVIRGRHSHSGAGDTL